MATTPTAPTTPAADPGMSPRFNSTETNKYTPILYSKKVMYLFVESTVLHEVTNNDYEGEITNKGDKVEIRVAPSYIAIAEYVAGVDVDFTTEGQAARFLNIDCSIVAAFKFDEIEKIQSDMGLMNIYAKKAAESLAIYTATDVLKVMGLGAHADNQGTTAGKVSGGYALGAYVAADDVGNVPVQIDATNALDYLVDLGTVLDEYDIPMDGRFICLPAWYCGMLKKSDLKAADVTGDNTGVIRTGLIGEVNNFKIYQSNLLHTSVDADEATTPGTGLTGTHVVAGVVDATTFASQITKTTITEAEDTFEEKWKTLMVYGRKVIMPEALALLYCYK